MNPSHPHRESRPGSAEPIVPNKLYTPATANRTLPLVRNIVVDILAKAKELRGHQVLSGGPADNEGAEQIRGEIVALMGELEELGCHFKDWNFDVGLVDFPAEIDGSQVYLCWKSDEPAVAWYPPVTGGFSDRQPVPAELLEDG